VAKKRLELTPPAENAAAPEARYQRADRRLELVDEQGKTHEKLSHETGVVVVDQSGNEEYRRKEEEGTAERVARKREFYAREDQKLKEVFSDSHPSAQMQQSICPFELASKIVLSISVVYFGSLGFYNLVCLALGHAAPLAFTYAGMALAAAIVLGFHWLPLSLARPLARLGYSGVLLYFGVTGILHLVRLYQHPPTRGVNWSNFGLSFFSIVAAFFLVRAIRRAISIHSELFLSRENAQHPYFVRYPALQNPEALRLAIYAVEGAIFTMGLLVVSSVVSVIYPSALFLYVCAFMAFVAFRATFFSID
jgi:hypothetical protein